MADETQLAYESIALDALSEVPSYASLYEVLPHEHTGYFDRVTVPAPALPEGVRLIKEAELDIEKECFRIDFGLKEYGGVIKCYVGENILDDPAQPLKAQFFVFTPDGPKIPGKVSLFYGGVSIDGMPFVDAEDLNDHTIDAVVNVFPGIVIFLQKLAAGEALTSTLELRVDNPASLPEADTAESTPSFPEDKEFRIEALEAGPVNSRVQNVLESDKELVQWPESDEQLLYLDEVDEGIVFEYRAIGEGSEVSNSIFLRTQTGALLCVADSVSHVVSYNFYKRYGNTPLSAEALRTERYYREFNWRSEEELPLGYIARRELYNADLALFRDHLRILHEHITQS